MKLSNLDFRTDVLPFVVATAGEFAALYFWLLFLDAGRWVVANVVLWAGFAVERIAVYLWIQSVYRKKEGRVERRPLLITVFALFAITLSEVLIWVFWVALADGEIGWLALSGSANFILAGGILMILMLIEHSIEMAALRRTKPFLYVTNVNTVIFTFMEVLGAVGWLYFVRSGEPVLGGLCLLAGLSIEHVLQGSELRPETTVPSPQPAAAG